MNTDRFKFRVWCNTHNEWEQDETFIGAWVKLLQGSSRRGYMEISWNNHIIEQCTGLKDKNGVLIYEGDIVSYYMSVLDTSSVFSMANNKKIRYEVIGLIYWSKAYNGWRIDNGECGNAITPDDEVIGNIHENPELLESDNV